MYTIATLHHLRQFLGLASGDTADDTRLLGSLQAASAQIERAAGRQFCPRIAVLKHRAARGDSRYLLLHDDLLSLTTITDGDGIMISLNDLVLLPSGLPPYNTLYLTNGRTFLSSSALDPYPVTVTGVWGWHERWSEAWRVSNDTVQSNPLSNSATTLTVSNAAGADSYGESPRFHIGHLLKIEEEYLRVIAISGNTLTVLRGVNGTSAVQHSQNTPISTFQPAPDVLLLTLRWAAWLYKSSDSVESGQTPEHLRSALAEVRRVWVRA